MSRTHRVHLMAPAPPPPTRRQPSDPSTARLFQAWSSLADDWDSPEAWRKMPLNADGTAPSTGPRGENGQGSGSGSGSGTGSGTDGGSADGPPRLGNGLTWRPPEPGDRPPFSGEPQQRDRDPNQVYLPSFAAPVRTPCPAPAEDRPRVTRGAGL